MGSPKALLAYRGETFLDRLIGVLGTVCAPVVVVLGYDAGRIEAGIARRGEVKLVRNPAPERGQLSSLKVGLAWIAAGAVIFTPLDYPAVEGATVAAIADALRGGNGLVVPAHAGRRGHPVGIARELMEEILALPDEGQAREVIHRHQATYVDVPDDGILLDVDDAAAYHRLMERQ